MTYNWDTRTESVRQYIARNREMTPVDRAQLALDTAKEDLRQVESLNKRGLIAFSDVELCRVRVFRAWLKLSLLEPNVLEDDALEVSAA